MALLEIQNVSVQFGGLRAISDFSMEIEKGSIAGLIGPNGAGKTTFFNVVTGVVQPTTGELFFGGTRLNRMRPDRVAHLGIARTFQNIRLFTKMSVIDNVAIGIHRTAQYSVIEAMLGTPRVRRMDKEVRRQAMEYLEAVDLKEYGDSIAGELPYGIQRRVEIARAIATNPRLLLLDEPAAGMNNEETAELVRFIRMLHDRYHEEMTILLIEHHLEMVMELCQQITVLNLGEKLACGTPEEIQSDPRVIRAYIGERRKGNGEQAVGG